MSPGITVRFDASTIGARVIAFSVRHDSDDPVALDDDVDIRSAPSGSSCPPAGRRAPTRRLVGTAGVYFRSSGTVRVAPVSTSTIRSLSNDW